MNLKVDHLSLQGPALASAYAANDRSVTSYYLAGSPADIDSYRIVIQRIRAKSPPSRWEALSRAFSPSCQVAADKLREVVQEKGVFVATGQQAGLFISPLFTIYKALTAAKLAAQIEERLGIPTMPLFSVASEDHDWAEVDHTHILDLENQLVRISVRASGVDGPDTATPPVERLAVGDDIEAAFDLLTRSTPDTEFKADVLAGLRSAYRVGRPYAEAFQTALAHLLRRHSFLVLRAADPYVKSQTRELLWSEWLRRDESAVRLETRAQELRAAGFEVQVPVRLGTTNLFLEGRLGRDRLVWEGDAAILRRAETRLSSEELRELLEASPHKISPGALLRPVTEARAFPVVAHVGGPSEVAYLAQSQSLYDMHGIPAPVVVPRASLLLIEPKVERVLEKFRLTPGDLAGDLNTAVSGILNELAPPQLQERLRELRQQVATGLDRLESAAIEFDPGSRSLMGSGKQAIFGSIKALESKLQGRVREKNETALRQIEKAAANLYPSGSPQERVLNPYPYLIRYGEGLLDTLYASVVTPLG